MERASYRHGVEWIAFNDGAGDAVPGQPDAEEVVAGQISTGLLADLFGVAPQRVAQDVMRRRAKAVKDGDL